MVDQHGTPALDTLLSKLTPAVASAIDRALAGEDISVDDAVTLERRLAAGQRLLHEVVVDAGRLNTQPAQLHTQQREHAPGGLHGQQRADRYPGHSKGAENSGSVAKRASSSSVPASRRMALRHPNNRRSPPCARCC